MKVLLASGASYEPPKGGSTRSNRAWLEVLAARGNECRVVCASDSPGELTAAAVRVFRFADPSAVRAELIRQIETWQPDHVLVSTEDVGQQLLIAAQEHASGRVVYLAHTPQMFPFGPASLHPSEAGARVVAACAHIVAIGRFTAEYIQRHTGRRAVIVHPPMYAGASRVQGQAIGFINPCAVKGLPIFLELARRFPHLQFLALPGWGTTKADLKALAGLPNVNLVPPVPDIQQFFERIRVLLVPSLWPEGFGLVATEAMLRGVPVLAADHGGLPEAKLGVPYLLPVRPIERYETRFDEVRLPVPVIPEQDIAPWAEALERLTSHASHLRSISDESHAAAHDFVRALDPLDFERALTGAMRLLLVQNSQYFPAFGGGNVSNRLLMEALAARGHRCRVVTRIDATEKRDAFLEDLRSRGVGFERHTTAVDFRLNGVEVRTETDVAHARERWLADLQRFAPDWTLVSSDDPAQLFLDRALDATGGRVVYLSRTTLALPFGPDAALSSTARTESLRRTAAVVGVSEYVAEYVRRWSGIPARHVPISLQGNGPFPRFGAFDRGFVTMVNPCAIKGLPIFLEVARACPEYAFAAVPTWGTTEHDLAALRALPNVTVLPASDRIDDILSQTRVMVVPSLWAEARSRIVVEALLRGVPVLAADVGGIPEAMMGLDYLLPVRPIERYRPEVDEQLVPVAEVPLQDASPWIAALRELLSERVRYETLSEESRRRALSYAESADIQPFESLLRQLEPGVSVKPAPAPRARAVAAASLSPVKRSLLAAKLRERRLTAEPAIISGHAPRVPLSYAQLRMLSVHDADPDRNVQNVVLARRVKGPLDRAWLERRLNEIGARHEAMRTCFRDGELFIDSAARIEVREQIDPTAPFDLTRAPLVRAALDGETLTLVVHHAISDGWSSGIFARELSGAILEPVRPYSEWVQWQRQQVERGVWDEQRDYWRRELADSRHEAPVGPFTGARAVAEPPELATFPSATPFMTALAAWAAVLHLWTGEDRVVLGTPVANRHAPGFDNTIGLFTNIVLLPISARAATPFDELVASVRETALDAFRRQDYPFELLGIPAPRLLFAYQNAGGDALRLPGVTLEHIEFDTGKAEHDLRLSVSAERTVLQYRTDFATGATAARLLGAFLRICETVAVRPQLRLSELRDLL